MLSLLIATLCSASIALLFKLSETRDCNRYAVTCANYIVAFLLSIALMVLGGSGSLPVDWSPVVRFALFFGAFVGIAFYIGYILFQLSIRRHGAAMTSAFGKMGVLVPMLLSLLIWREWPLLIQWLGIALALSAVVLACLPGIEKGSREPKTLLIVVLLVLGICEFSTKLYQTYGTSALKPFFFLVVFFFASVLSAVETRRRSLPIGKLDLTIGAVIGFPNIFSAWFLIDALDMLPAAVVFPFFSAGSIAVISMGGVVFFGERPARRDLIALLLVIPALVLINL